MTSRKISKFCYVITYRSSINADPKQPRTVRVELVDAKTGGPLQIMDSNGQPVRARLIFQQSYVPGAVSAQTSAYK